MQTEEIDPRVHTEEVEGKGWRYEVLGRGWSVKCTEFYVDRAAARAAGKAWLDAYEVEHVT
jgi:hypothetical protein